MRRSRALAPGRRALSLLALCMAAFVISLDTTIVNVALPSLVRQLRASITDLQWVVDAYSLMFTTLILAAGEPQRPCRLTAMHPGKAEHGRRPDDAAAVNEVG